MTTSVGTQSTVEKPYVSVCVVTYNQEPYIDRALRSVLEQEVRFPVEVLVYDDRSTDGTESVIKKIVDKHQGVVRQIRRDQNVGAYRAFQLVHREARGRFVAHLDGDDYFLPGKLASQTRLLEECPNCNIVWHRVRIRCERSGIERPDFNPNTRIEGREFERPDLLLLGSVGCHSSRMYRSGIWNGHDPDTDRIDFYYDVKMIGSGYALILNDVLGVYRLGQGVAGSQKTDQIYRDHLREFLLDYPQYKGEIAANLLLKSLVRLRHKKNGLHELLLACRNPSLRLPLCLLRLRREILNFRAKQ